MEIHGGASYLMLWNQARRCSWLSSSEQEWRLFQAIAGEHRLEPGSHACVVL